MQLHIFLDDLGWLLHWSHCAYLARENCTCVHVHVFIFMGLGAKLARKACISRFLHLKTFATQNFYLLLVQIYLQLWQLHFALFFAVCISNASCMQSKSAHPTTTAIANCNCCGSCLERLVVFAVFLEQQLLEQACQQQYPCWAWKISIVFWPWRMHVHVQALLRHMSISFLWLLSAHVMLLRSTARCRNYVLRVQSQLNNFLVSSQTWLMN